MPKECDFIKRINELIFRAVGLMFSALILVLSLLNSISLAAVSEAAAGLAEKTEELESENRVLSAELACRFTLREIETYAEQVLGMQRCSGGQIVRIDMP